MKANNCIAFKRITELNVEAVRLYECGDVANSFKALISAIEMVHETLCEDGDGDHTDNTNNCCSIGDDNESVATKNSLETSYSIRPREECLIFHDIYEGMFMLDSNSVSIISRSRQISILLFNLALLYHKLGIRSEKTDYYNKASHIYKKSMDLVEKSMTTTSMEVSTIALKAAICCNLSKILIYDTSDRSNSMTYYDRMLVNCMRDLYVPQVHARLSQSDKYVFHYMFRLYEKNKDEKLHHSPAA